MRFRVMGSVVAAALMLVLAPNAGAAERRVAAKEAAKESDNQTSLRLDGGPNGLRLIETGPAGEQLTDEGAVVTFNASEFRIAASDADAIEVRTDVLPDRVVTLVTRGNRCLAINTEHGTAAPSIRAISPSKSSDEVGGLVVHSSTDMECYSYENHYYSSLNICLPMAFSGVCTECWESPGQGGGVVEVPGCQFPQHCDGDPEEIDMTEGGV